MELRVGGSEGGGSGRIESGVAIAENLPRLPAGKATEVVLGAYRRPFYGHFTGCLRGPESSARFRAPEMAYAVIRSGGKQYRVMEGDTVRVDLLTGAAGDKIKFDDVLMIGGDEPKIGKPKVAGASVEGEIVGEAQGKKLVVFKFRKRKRSRKKAGHR